MATRTLAELHIDDVTIRDTGKVARIEGQSVSKEEAEGEIQIFEVSAPDFQMQIGYATWESGEADVRALSVLDGSQALMRLDRGGLRLGVYPLSAKTSWFELRQARVKLDTNNKWSNLFNATTYALDEGAQLDVVKQLKKVGAKKIGTKADLLGADNRTKSRLCAVFPPSKKAVPVAAFVVTRVLPLRYEYPA